MSAPDESPLRRRIGGGPPEPAQAQPPPLPPQPAPPTPPQPAQKETAAPQSAAQPADTAPGPGEIDIIAAPLPYADDRHRFEKAVRRLRGVRETRPISHAGGVFRLRVVYRGEGRLGTHLARVHGFRVKVLSEKRAVLEVLVEPA